MTRRVTASFYRSRVYLRFRYPLLLLLARSATQAKFFSFAVRSTPAKRSFALRSPSSLNYFGIRVGVGFLNDPSRPKV